MKSSPEASHPQTPPPPLLSFQSLLRSDSDGEGLAHLLPNDFLPSVRALPVVSRQGPPEPQQVPVDAEPASRSATAPAAISPYLPFPHYSASSMYPVFFSLAGVDHMTSSSFPLNGNVSFCNPSTVPPAFRQPARLYLIYQE